MLLDAVWQIEHSKTESGIELYLLCRFTRLYRTAHDPFYAGAASQMADFPHRRHEASFHYETLGTSAKRSKIKTHRAGQVLISSSTVRASL